MGLKTIAIYTEADRHSPYVNDADSSVKIDSSYLDSEAIIAAAKLIGAQAIHPGYGFLSENHEFANRVQNEGIIWVGPDPESIQIMGDKIEAKKHAVKSKIPISIITSTIIISRTNLSHIIFCTGQISPILNRKISSQ